MSFDLDTFAAYVDGEHDGLTAWDRARGHVDAALAAEIARHRALRSHHSAHSLPPPRSRYPSGCAR